jgi:hypothetical protein
MIAPHNKAFRPENAVCAASEMHKLSKQFMILDHVA